MTRTRRSSSPTSPTEPLTARIPPSPQPEGRTTLDTFTVKFEPDTLHAQAERGTTILEAARESGASILAPCGGQGTCGKCRCRVVSGEILTDESHKGRIAQEDFAAGMRLACRTTVEGDLVVYIPPESRASGDRILEDTGIGLDLTARHPSVRKQFLTLAEPSLTDQRSDLERVLAALEELGEPVTRIDYAAVLPTLAEACRAEGFRVTAVLWSEELLCVEPGDTSATAYLVAVDLGTTTVVAYLADLATGRRLGTASTINPQVAYGDDLVSRITWLESVEGGRAVLAAAARGAIRGLVAKLCAKAGASESHVYHLAVVGNSGMSHIHLGADPRNIPLAPYAPCFRAGVTLAARDLGYEGFAPGARVSAVPNIAGWVGSDTVGLILSTAMHREEGVRVAIDIGTNGEIVVGGSDRMVACSTAAGPAFEGAQILHGMRGAEGAIDHVRLEGDEVRVTTIEGAPARGICGTGLIDAAATLLRTGVVLDTGRMIAPGSDEAARLSPSLTARLVLHDEQPAFVLVAAADSATGAPVLLTQRDVRQLQLAKGAIGAGVRVALARLGVEAGDVLEVLLAGAFGSYVDPASAAAIGLFPRELADRARAVGNAAGAGAWLVLLDAARLAEAETIRQSVEYLELASLLEFDMAFADEMMFPSDE